MITAILLCATVAVQPQTVTFSHRADSSSRVLAALSKEIGMSLRPSGQVIDDVFLLHFSDVPVDEVLEKIADGLNATWRKSGDVYYLTRTSANRLMEARELRDAYERGLETYRERTTVPAPLTAEEFRKYATSDVPLSTGVITPYDPPKDQTPGRRAVKRLMLEMTPELIAGLPNGVPVVLAINPSPWQERLPGSAKKILKDFANEHDLLKSVSQSLPREYRYQAHQIYRSLRRDGALGKPVITVTRQNWYVNLVLTVFVGGVPIERYYESAGARRAQGESEVDWSKYEQDVEWTAEDQQLSDYKASAPTRTSLPAMPIPEAVLELLKNIDQREPLSGGPSTALLQFLNETGLNAVVSIPDIAFLSPRNFRDANLGAAARAAVNGRTRVVDGWLFGATSQLVTARATREDRNAGAKFIRGSLKRGHATLDTLADYYKATGEPVYMNGFISMALEKRSSSSAWGSGRVLAFELYAHLPPSARSEAKQGSYTIPWSELPIKARNLLLDRVRRSMLAITDQPYEVPWTGWRSVRETDLLPSTVIGAAMPRGTVVRVTVERRDSLSPTLPKNARWGGFSRYLSTEDFARDMVLQEKGAPRSEADYSMVTVNSSVRVLMQIEMPGVGYFQDWTIVSETPFDLKPILRSQAPEGLRAALEQEIAKARVSYQNVTFGGRAGKIPPP